MGGGESGTGAAFLAKKKGYSVLLSDNGTIKDEYKSLLTNAGIDYEEKGHSINFLTSAKEIIKSPGIPDEIKIIKEIKKQNIPIVSEIEFATRFTEAKIIAVTGSNGKTTTTLLTYHILKKAGLNVGVAGNIGKSFAMSVATSNYDVYILELSSFQLDGIKRFKADIAILLNITPDHLDRYHNSFDKYAESKFRITNNQTSQDAFIYCLDDQKITQLIKKHNPDSQLFPFSLKSKNIIQGAYCNENEIIIKVNKTQVHMTLEKLALQGKHNTYNSMAAGISARLMDIRRDSLKQAFSDYQNIAHRLEYVSTIHGIEFINDSKATNVNSVWYALEFYSKPIVWIAGGQDKGNDYSGIKNLVKEKVKAIVCLGKDNTKIHNEFGDIVEVIEDTTNAQDAVVTAYKLAHKGDIVLLSPACASFDLFENFEDRGNQFKEAVKAL